MADGSYLLISKLFCMDGVKGGVQVRNVRLRTSGEGGGGVLQVRNVTPLPSCLFSLR